MVDPMVLQFHTAAAEMARQQYLRAGAPELEAVEWQQAVRDARKLIAETLRASNYLRDIPAALRQAGSHMLVLRNLAAPPISQDQFKLVCPAWNKTSEKPGGRVSPASVDAVVQAVWARRDRHLTRWVDTGRLPTRQEIRRLLFSIGSLLAAQQLGTSRRNRRAAEQEGAVTRLLIDRGWTRLPSRQIDARAALPAMHFMHKTRFATTTQPQEVDIACGLGGTVVLAMECKVTNDATNSVKRINDVLKKSASWRAHWGSFVRTAALLQGVIKPEDVHRLLEAQVEVFWSHDLDRLSDWLDQHRG